MKQMRRALLLAALLLPLTAGTASAQMTPELSGSWGWMWGGSASSLAGTFRLDDAASYSATASFPAGNLNWVEAHYSYQGSAMTLDGFGRLDKLTDIGVHYMQIGGLRGIKDGPVVPYVVGGIGATYYSPSESVIQIDGTTYGLDSSWKLSFALGAGVKVWLGEEERVGLRLQFRVLPTLYNSSTGVWVGGGGGGISVNGSAIWQFDASAGVTVKLGG